MISKSLCFAGLIFLSCSSSLKAQTSFFPYVEKFDTVVAPRLPAGWTTTSNKSPSGDFTTSTSATLSEPNDVVTTDAKVTQSLTSPVISFQEKIPAYIEFHERRTSSHNSGLLVEALVNGDTSSAIPIGDTLKNEGGTGYITRSLSLPLCLAGIANVRFRWRIAGNGTGSTGTLRMDDVSITVQKQRDLAITVLRVEPANIRSGETIAVRVGVSNHALAGTFSLSLQLFDDRNSDTLATADEKIAQQTIDRSFTVAESTSFTLNYPSISPGSHRLIVKLVLPGDEDSTNNTSTTTILVGYSRHYVVINEIMYAPSAGPEWVECINNSSDTVSLSQWKIGDNTGSRAVMTPGQMKIPPQQFFVITKDSSIFIVFPAINVPVIKASFPALNNDGDAVIIFDPTGSAIDSVAYAPSWGGTGGKSLERIDTASGSTSSLNWGSSRNPSGATPGFVNSLTKKDFDASIERITISTATPEMGEPVHICAIVKNNGRKPLTGISVHFFRDWNNDSIPEGSELFSDALLGILFPADSEMVQVSMSITAQGEQRIIVLVEAQQDEDTTNNSASLSFIVGVRPRSVVINEIMYAPPGDMPEWIEFYNAATSVVDASGWRISDSNVKSRTLLTDASFSVQPGAYFLLATDSTLANYFSISAPLRVSSFSALNNSTPDAVVLYDNRGVTMDSVWYKPSWGGTNGRSLERIDYLSPSVDSANWRSSMPTPGFENSVAKKDIDLEVTRLTGTRTSDGICLTASVYNAGRKAVPAFVVRFFYDGDRDSVASSGELLKSLQEPGLNAADSLTTQFDWQTNVKGSIPIICRVEVVGDQRTPNNEKIAWMANSFLSQSVVINEIMYDPLPGRSEFVELFNRSPDTLDLQEWKIMDMPSSSGSRTMFRLSDHRIPFPPGDYVVVGADSTLITQFPHLASQPSAKVVVANRDLSLNNSGDDVILLDLTDARIDSVRYFSSWNNPVLNTSTSGKSLERINPSLSSNDKRNWSSSISPAGATPGERNSIYTVALPSAARLQLSPNPFSPDNDGFEDFLALNYSLPSTTSMIRVRCFDVQGRLIRTVANNEPASSSGTVLWDGLDDNSQHVRIGMYIILFEAFDVNGGLVRTMKDVAVVARKL